MRIDRRQVLRLVGASALGIGAPGAARSQAYPVRAVRMIVPFTAGGPTDLLARLIAGKLSADAGHQFYVDNVAGAGGNIGTARVAKAAPDGHTILVTGANIVINPILYGQAGYEPFKDFDAVTLAATSPAILTVHPSLPVVSVSELVGLLRSQPGKYAYASPGAGTPPHLVGELFRLSLRLDLTHVPFKGGGEAMASTVAGHTPISFGAMAPAVPQVISGAVKALAIANRARSPALPAVPTMAEAGFPEIEGSSWFAVAVPAGTPRDIVTGLHREIARHLASADASERLSALGYEPVANSPEACSAFFQAESAKWAKVIRAAGIEFK